MRYGLEVRGERDLNRRRIRSRKKRGIDAEIPGIVLKDRRAAEVLRKIMSSIRRWCLLQVWRKRFWEEYSAHSGNAKSRDKKVSEV